MLINNDHCKQVVGDVDPSASEAGRSTSDVLARLYGAVCFATLALMGLTEQFENLPGAVAAFAAGWYLAASPRGGGTG
jgi:hypothetical protein